MKTVFLSLAALVAIASPASAQQAADGADPQHRLPTELAGNWSVKQSIWMSPGAAPKIDRGSAEFAPVLNRRHLRQSLHIADGTGFEGLGYFGYDGAAGQFFMTWMDVNLPGIILAQGDYDPGTKAYILRGTQSEPDEQIPVREVLTLIDRDHFNFEFYETRQQQESLMVKLEYSRAGAGDGGL